MLPRTATPRAVESCCTASKTPEADPISSVFTLVRMNWKSCPMVAPTPAPMKNRPGTRSGGGGARTDERQREPGRAGGDEQDAEMEQVTSEPPDGRVGADHAEDHPHDHRRQRQTGVDR